MGSPQASATACGPRVLNGAPLECAPRLPVPALLTDASSRALYTKARCCDAWSLARDSASTARTASASWASLLPLVISSLNTNSKPIALV